MSSPWCVGGSGRTETGHQQSPGLQVPLRGTILCLASDLPVFFRITQPVAMWNRRADITQPCLTPVFTWKLWSLFPTLHVKIVVKALDEKDNLLWLSICTVCAKGCPCGCCRKPSPQVPKVDVELSLPFRTLLDDVTQWKDLVYRSFALPEACLFLPQLLVYCII